MLKFESCDVTLSIGGGVATAKGELVLTNGTKKTVDPEFVEETTLIYAGDAIVAQSVTSHGNPEPIAKGGALSLRISFGGSVAGSEIFPLIGVSLQYKSGTTQEIWIAQSDGEWVETSRPDGASF